MAYCKVLLTFVFSVLATSKCSDDRQCVDLTENAKATSLNCKFSDLAKNSIECDTLARARDYAPFFTFPFYVHTKYYFSVSEYIDDTLSPGGSNETVSSSNDTVWRCLHLRSSTGRKIHLPSPWKNVTVPKYLDPFHMYLLIGAKEMVFDKRYYSENPVGYVRLNKYCLDISIDIDQSSCIEEVKVMNLVMDPGNGKNPYMPEYWEEMRKTNSKILGLSGSRLVFDFDPSYIISTPVYIEPFLNDTGLHEVRITGLHLQAMGHILHNLPNLLVLDLSNNEITTIDPENFKSVPNINNLILSNNSLLFAPEGIRHLNDLNVLDVSGNPLLLDTDDQINNFTEVLQTNPNIDWLDLSHTSLKSMAPLRELLGSRNGSSKLKMRTLKLSNCEIVNLDDESSRDIFTHQVLLESLDLSGNKITSLPSDLFTGLQNLRYLNLSRAGLTRGIELSLPISDSLQILDLSHNNITEIGEVKITGRVTMLDLSHNLITKWNVNDVFICKNYSVCPSNKKESWVSHLNISDNKITSLTNEMVTSFNHMSSVDLGCNFIDCKACDMPILQTWLRQIEKNEINVLILNDGNIADVTCFTPIQYSGIPVKAVEIDPESCHSES